jgi:hypothetical protein
MKLSEVVTSPIKTPNAPGMPGGPIAANTAAASTTANVGTAANTQPSIGSTTAPQPTAPAKPATPQTIDSLAQILKSAGLTPSQLSQITSKAK